jgi:hypothetical protein
MSTNNIGFTQAVKRLDITKTDRTAETTKQDAVVKVRPIKKLQVEIDVEPFTYSSVDDWSFLRNKKGLLLRIVRVSVEKAFRIVNFNNLQFTGNELNGNTQSNISITLSDFQANKVMACISFIDENNETIRYKLAGIKSRAAFIYPEGLPQYVAVNETEFDTDFATILSDDWYTGQKISKDFNLEFYSRGSITTFSMLKCLLKLSLLQNPSSIEETSSQLTGSSYSRNLLKITLPCNLPASFPVI